MTTTAYFDCFSGASGDMILGALVDAGGDIEFADAQLHALGLNGWSLETRTESRRGIRGTRVMVETADQTESRNYRDIVAMLYRSTATPRTKDSSLKAFRLLAEAEGRIHSQPVEEVHFHEVGSTDAIGDVVGAMALLEQLRVDEVVVSPLPLGSGTVTSAHGLIPVPAPAVTELLRGAVVTGSGSGELVTPTAAAIFAAVASAFGDAPALRLGRVGYGVGARDTEMPNLLRVLVGERAAAGARRDHVLIETNVDDMNPELLPHVLDLLVTAGADDAWVAPILMKKGRPAHQLSVLSIPANADRLIDVIYNETTTLGLRVTQVAKDELDRHWVEVQVQGEPVRVKVASRAGAVVTLAPEYEDARRAARATGLPLKEIYARAEMAARAERAPR